MFDLAPVIAFNLTIIVIVILIAFATLAEGLLKWNKRRKRHAAWRRDSRIYYPNQWKDKA